MDIQYVERSSQEIKIERVYGHRALSLLYGDSWLSRLFAWAFLPWIARVPFFSKFYGFLQKLPSSRKKIEPFLKTYGVDRSEFLIEDFGSFNDFFIRKLKPECRPIVKDPRVAALPADGRYLVFPDLTHVKQFYMKGQTFDLAQFLQNSAYANRYQDGAMVIARLCPTDYHRFHFPVDGTASKPQRIGGDLFSVNPIALKKRLSILWQNQRMVTEIDSVGFGVVLSIEVGATCVGTIHQTYLANSVVRKGDEKGYFSFGGSCIVLLFERGKILFDRDLVEASQKGLETRALFGQSLGALI